MADYDFLKPPPEPPRPPLRTLTKTPGQDLAAGVRSGDKVLVRPGVYPPFAVSGLESVRWEWAEPGQHWTVDGRNSAEFALRVNDRNRALEFLGLRMIRAGHGVRATVSPGLRFRHYRAENCGAEGFQAGWCDDLLLEDFYIEGTGKGWEGSSGTYPPHKGHGVYLSKRFTGGTVRRGVIKDCGGCAVQLNASDGKRITGIALADLQTFGCGTEGTPHFNLMGVQDSTLRNILGAEGNAGCAMFEDRGSEACRNVTLANWTMYLPRGKYGLQLSARTRAVTVQDSILACQPGPVRQFVVAELVVGAGPDGEDLTVLAEVPAEEAVEAAPETAGVVRWFGNGGESWARVASVLDPVTLASLLPGVGWHPA